MKYLIIISLLMPFVSHAQKSKTKDNIGISLNYSGYSGLAGYINYETWTDKKNAYRFALRGNVVDHIGGEVGYRREILDFKRISILFGADLGMIHFRKNNKLLSSYNYYYLAAPFDFRLRITDRFSINYTVGAGVRYETNDDKFGLHLLGRFGLIIRL